MKHRADEIVQRMGDLPSLPQAASAALKLLRDPGVTAAQMEQVICKDPSLAATILRIANSALFGVREEVSTLHRAVVVIGINALPSIILSAVTEAMCRSPRVKDLLLWEHSIAVALASQEIARATTHLAVEEAFVAGLLHDVGKVVLRQQADRQYDEVIERVCSQGQTFIEAEEAVFDFDHTTVGALVIHNWGLPSQLEEAVRMHHEPQWASGNPSFCAVVSLANSMCVQMEIGLEKRRSLDLMRLDATRMLELSEPQLRDIAESVQLRVREEFAAA